MEYTDGSTHEGEWVSDEPCGSGLEKLSDGSMNEGDFLCGKRRGFDTCDFSDGRPYKGKARISSQGLATIVAKLATRLRSAGPGMKLPKVRVKIRVRM